MGDDTILLLAGLLAMVCAFYAYRWPTYAVALAVGAIPVYLVRLNIFGLPTNLFEVIVVSVLAVHLFKKDCRREFMLAWQGLSAIIKAAVALFVVAAVVSTAVSDVPLVSLGILKSWIVFPLIAAWLVYVTIRYSLLKTKLITSVLVVSGLAVALISLSQYETGQRLSGFYDVPNSLALWLAPLCVLAVVYYLSEQQLGHNRFYLLAGTVMFFVLLLTQSVTGIASLLIVLLAAIVLVFKKRSMAAGRLGVGVAALVVIILSLVVLAPRFSYLLSYQTESSLAVRFQLWDVSGRLIRDNPVWGVGLGQFEPYYQAELHRRFAVQDTASSPIPEWVFRDPHNWILSFWVNLGLLGLLSFVFIHGWIFYMTREAWFQNTFPFIAALSTLLIFGLADTIYWKNDLAALHWVLIALLLAVIGSAGRVQSDP